MNNCLECKKLTAGLCRECSKKQYIVMKKEQTKEKWTTLECCLCGGKPLPNPKCDCKCHSPTREEKNYARDYSHTHCWNQVNNQDTDIEKNNFPTCGQPLQNHKQCCLCDTIYKPRKSMSKEQTKEKPSVKHCPKGSTCYPAIKCKCHHSPTLEEKSCGICKKTIIKKSKWSQTQWNETKYCSQKCQWQSKKGKKFTAEHRKKIQEANLLFYPDSSYNTLHRWIKRWKGKPKKCERCGTIESKVYHWANVDHKYRRALEDFIRMCPKCHANHDREKGLRFKKKTKI